MPHVAVAQLGGRGEVAVGACLQLRKSGRARLGLFQSDVDHPVGTRDAFGYTRVLEYLDSTDLCRWDMGEQCACVKNDRDAVDTQLIFSEHLIEAFDSHTGIVQEEIPSGAFLYFLLSGTDHDPPVLQLDMWRE